MKPLRGAFGYTPAKDVVRVPTWTFTDMSDAGGRLATVWDNVMATVPFAVKK